MNDGNYITLRMPVVEDSSGRIVPKYDMRDFGIPWGRWRRHYYLDPSKVVVGDVINKFTSENGIVDVCIKLDNNDSKESIWTRLKKVLGLVSNTKDTLNRDAIVEICNRMVSEHGDVEIVETHVSYMNF